MVIGLLCSELSRLEFSSLFRTSVIVGLGSIAYNFSQFFTNSHQSNSIVVSQWWIRFLTFLLLASWEVKSKWWTPCRSGHITQWTLHTRNDTHRDCSVSKLSLLTKSLKNCLQNWTTSKWMLVISRVFPLISFKCLLNIQLYSCQHRTWYWVSINFTHRTL